MISAYKPALPGSSKIIQPNKMNTHKSFVLSIWH